MRLDYPSRGWAEVSWSRDEDLAHEATLLISELCDLPGVTLNEWMYGGEKLSLEAPRNVWTTATWIALVKNHIGYRREAADQDVHGWAPDFQPRRTLYPHQVLGAQFLIDGQGGLCADQMGLGKTTSAIVAAEVLAFRNGPERFRVVLGPKYTRDVWRRELLAVGAIEDETEFFFAEGQDPRQKDVDWDRVRWVFCHYDIAHFWTTFLQRSPDGPPVVAILDELHWLKNGRNKRSKAAQAIAGCAPFRIGLTGTPMANRPSELWWPLTILDGKRSWGSPLDFRRRYAGAVYQDQFGGYADTEPTHVDELRARLSGRYLRRTIDDAEVSLPKLTRQLMNVELDEKARETYDGIVKTFGKDSLVRAVLERRAGKNTLAAITKLRKLTSKAKEQATLDYALEALRSGDSVVIGTWQRTTADKFESRLLGAFISEKSDDHIFLAHGGYSQDTRDRAVEAFQKLGGVLVTTIDALKEGVTLTKARHIIMHDLSWVPSDILQFEARVYRIGQDKPVQSVWMVCPDSIDVLFAATLAGKADVISEMLGITAAQEAAEELGLEEFSVASSVEADIARLLEQWR